MFESDVYLEPEKHQYFNSKGQRYLSVSALLDKIKNKFDSEKISYFSAKKRLKEKGVELSEENIRQAQQIVLSEWRAKNVAATDHGTLVHNLLETYQNTTKILNKELEPMVRGVSSYFVKYPVQAQEQVLHSNEYMVAGTTDKAMKRTRSVKGTIDFADYKTNEEITYFSKYDNYLKYPLEHLEECSYNTYALQLSMYAYLSETTHGAKIGRLYIIHIPKENPLNYRIIPVPYMKWEVMRLLEHFKDEILVDLGQQTEVEYEYQSFE